MVEFTREAIWSWTFVLGKFLIADSISLPINSLFRFSVSSWLSLVRMCVSGNLFIILGCSICWYIIVHSGLPDGLVVKNPSAMQETWVWSLDQEDSPREGNDNPLQYSCLGNPMGRGTWWATVHRVAKESDMT